jgi:purine-binding chemotaxis protein CheW
VTDATAPSQARAHEEIHALFAFRVGSSLLACPAEAVAAVIATTPPTPLPRVPAHVLGLVNHDHRALAVLDLGRVLGLDAGPAPSTRTLVLQGGEYRVGVPVGAALGVATVPSTDLRPPSGAFGPRVEAFLRAECETPHGRAAWLDLPRLLEAARA